MSEPKYPWTLQTVTRSGHEFTVDDTPDKERLRYAHKSGTYFEMSQDGRKVELVQANDYKYIKGGLTLTIDDNGDIKVGGSVRFVVGGDFYGEIKGNAIAAIGGSLVATVNKDLDAHVGQNATATVGKDLTAVVGRDAATTVGHDMSAFVAGNMSTSVTGESYEVVQGNKTIVVGGAFEIKAARITETSDSTFDMNSTTQTTITAGTTLQETALGDINTQSGGNTVISTSNHISFKKA